MKDCTTCKYGYEDERLGIPMCHHPKRFSEDCVDFNMHEEKEIETERSGSSEIPKDLEEASKEYCPDDAYPFGPKIINQIVRKAFIAGAEWKDRSLNWIRDLVKAAIKKPEEAQGILERIDRMLNKEEQK